MGTAPKTIAYRRKTADQRKRELIRAGIACLGKGGIAAFTIDQICREAGVSRGLINHHFKTKEDLMTQIYAYMSEHLATEAKPDPERQLAACIDSNFDVKTFNRANLNAWLSIYGQVSSNPTLKILYRQRYNEFKTQIEQSLDCLSRAQGLRLDIVIVARQLIALIDGLWLNYCLHGDAFSLTDAQQDCFRLLQAYGFKI